MNIKETLKAMAAVVAVFLIGKMLYTSYQDYSAAKHMVEFHNGIKNNIYESNGLSYTHDESYYEYKKQMESSIWHLILD